MTEQPKRPWRVFAEFSWAAEENVGRAFASEERARAFGKRLVEDGAWRVRLWQAADRHGHIVDNRIESLAG